MEELFQPASIPTTENLHPRREAWLDKSLFAALNWEKALYIAFFVLAVFSRFWDMGARVMSHDESLHTYFSYKLAQGEGFQHTPLMHGPFLFHITALSYFLFGDNDFTSRIPPAIFGIVLVILPYFFRRWLGRTGALAAAFFILISPSILYHARYIRQEEFILIWTILTALCTWRYIETKEPGWLLGLSAVLAFHATDKSTSFLEIALFVAFLAPVALWQLYAMRKQRSDVIRIIVFAAILGVALVAVSALYAIVGRTAANALGMESIVQPGSQIILSLSGKEMLFIAILIGISIPIVGGLVIGLRRFYGNWLAESAEAAPALNILLVMVTTTLFMASPALLLVLNRIWHATSGTDLVEVKLLGEMSNLVNNAQLITSMFSIAFALIAISVAIGLVWGWERWLKIIGVFLAITVPLFTTLFTNAAGIGSGFVGQLGYWMAQQDVQRGSQPPYYYFLIVPLYEYMLVIGTLCAMAYMGYNVVRYIMQPAAFKLAWLPSETEIIDESADDETNTDTAKHKPIKANSGLITLLNNVPPVSVLFPAFTLWWIIATWIIYSIAGEKMPWLTVHFALPMALLTGWFISKIAQPLVDLIRRERWSTTQAITQAGLALLAVVLIVHLLSKVFGLDIGPDESGKVFTFIGSFLAAAVGLALVGYAMWRTAHGGTFRLMGLAAFAFLSVLTIRTAFTVTYLNYDYTKEFLFYAHGAPGVKIALKQVDDLNARLGGKDPIRVGYTQETSWPLSWYMRSYPGQRFLGADLPQDYTDLQVIFASEQDGKFAEWTEKLSTDYTRYNYTLVWWPMQDYYDLTWDRIKSNLTDAKRRNALWEIIFNRNYKPYADLNGNNGLVPENWNPSHRFSLFIRNDVAAQVWDYQVGQVAGAGPRPVNQAPSAKIQNPAGLAIGQDGRRFLIDHKGARVFEVDETGAVLNSFGGFGSSSGKFNDPWGITVDADGNIYVADTFNHRVQKFNRDGQQIAMWGNPGVSNADGTGRDTQFFGPRDLLIDRNGNLLVTDTGNKRVQVFDKEGNYIRQFGIGGAGDGQFNEPVGLAQDGQGNIYVADTWNKRVQVFDGNYNFVKAIPVPGWQTLAEGELQDILNKPYMAVNGNTLYVSSPRGHTVMAFDLATGQPQELRDMTFSANDLPTGLAIFNNKLYVTNGANGQVLEFAIGAAQ